MLTKEEIESARRRTASILAEAGIVLTPVEEKNIEVADFGLGRLAETGLQLVVYTNNDRYCAKELVLFPDQTCPEHRHPPIGTDPGKRETFRCRRGHVLLYVDERPGDGSTASRQEDSPLQARIPAGSEPYYTARREIRLGPGDQYTIEPDTLHWFQALGEGAVVSEFSTTSRDEFDVFTDPRIERETRIEG